MGAGLGTGVNAITPQDGLLISTVHGTDTAPSTKDISSATENAAIAKKAAKNAPHIIFIMADQHRGDALGCMGNRAVLSPNIDQLAAEGTLFVNGFSSTPSSTPARAGLLTGLSPWKHGMLGYGKVATSYKYEMPRMLRDLGYFTYGIGKMHWHPQKALHGFHATLVDESGRAELPDFVSDYRQWFHQHAPGCNPDLTGIGWNDHRAATYKLDENLHPTAWTGQMATELIQSYESEKPLFLKVSFARPHSPYDPPRRFLDLYRNAKITPPYKGKWSNDRFGQRLDVSKAPADAATGNFGDEYAINSRRLYYANVTFIDEQIGHIIHALKEKGMYDNALICYTADHGDMLGDHHLWRKTYPYQGSVQVPYIVKWPQSMGCAVPRGSSLDMPVELRDFLPTFLDLAGGEVPSDMCGRSLAPLVRPGAPTAPWRKYLDLEHATCYRPDNYWCALTDGHLKYIWNLHNGEEQLFDLTRDPGEERNLSASASHASALRDLRAAMVEHLGERGDSFVKDGRLVTLNKTMLYSPNYPKEDSKKAG